MKSFRRLPMMRWPGLALAATPMLVAAGAFAASDDGHREHDPHEHGHGALDIVLEGEDLVAEFRIPAVNVVGFEHAPRDDAEREAVHQAVARFSDAAAVLVPSADAECEIEDVEAGVAGTDHDGPWKVGAMGEGEDHDDEEHEGEEHEHGADEHAKHEHEEEEHEEDGHEAEGHEHEEDEHEEDEHEEDEHEEDGHAEHEHEHEAHEGDSGAEAHSELHATYHFHCHAPERLARIDVRVFELLHDAEEIGVRVVTATAQSAMDLHPGETVVEISP